MRPAGGQITASPPVRSAVRGRCIRNRGPVTTWRLVLVAIWFMVGGCVAPVPAPAPVPVLQLPPPGPAAPAPADLAEVPAPEGAWREHRLARCTADIDIPAGVEKLLALSSEMYRERAGSDGIVELELALSGGQRHPLLLVTLGQLYLLAGQGELSLQPREGPARDVGSWARNQPRLLGRARQLFEESAAAWPDDAGIDYLLADVARAAGDTLQAAALAAGAVDKCTGGRSFRVMQFYQQLNRYPARHEGGPSPQYPAGARERREQGEVVVDLLLDPAAAVRQVHVVKSPSADLSDAAGACLRNGQFKPARIGKYPVWSWLRVTVAFRLKG